ncbi:MAG: hypothetical protein NTW50_05150 [Candidatus Berkelbacteria bacterium]|nr:hypothetical protein [Candidatus Berkelbacteria bacterium]
MQTKCQKFTEYLGQIVKELRNFDMAVGRQFPSLALISEMEIEKLISHCIGADLPRFEKRIDWQSLVQSKQWKLSGGFDDVIAVEQQPFSDNFVLLSEDSDKYRLYILDQKTGESREFLALKQMPLSFHLTESEVFVLYEDGIEAIDLESRAKRKFDTGFRRNHSFEIRNRELIILTRHLDVTRGFLLGILKYDLKGNIVKSDLEEELHDYRSHGLSTKSDEEIYTKTMNTKGIYFLSETADEWILMPTPGPFVLKLSPGEKWLMASNKEGDCYIIDVARREIVKSFQIRLPKGSRKIEFLYAADGRIFYYLERSDEIAGGFEKSGNIVELKYKFKTGK